ncbi:MAG: hypothetical protein ACREGJ_05095 [Candidatus Saccharimonadales bacterium]
MTTLTTFAEVYGSGTYGEGAYSSDGLGDLASTGYDVLIPIFLATALIIASVILVVKRLLRRPELAKQPVTTDVSEEQ